MSPVQAGILESLPSRGRYLFFSLAQTAELRPALQRLAALVDGQSAVVGLGPRTVAALGAEVAGLREFQALAGHGVDVPATPLALWCWLRGDDPGDLLLQGRKIEQALVPALHLHQAVDGFRHGRGPNGHGRDLTGYEDGTENPQGNEALAAAVVQAAEAGMDGSSFVTVQQWLHDFSAFEAMTPTEQDNAVGRRRCDNEELEDAPEAAHVKRTAQESFDPEAFVLRRSMPWSLGSNAGLMFVAFGRSLDAFEAQMRRMAGQDDGLTDAIFRFSRPVTGACAWCPPVRGGQLDLRHLGL